MALDNFEFQLESDFKGYNSSKDKTNIDSGYLVRGSKNVYKKTSGTIASRFGLKRRGAADATVAGVKSSYEWITSLGAELPLRVANSKLQVESKFLDGTTPVWYDLMTGLTLTRFVFSPWWDNTAKKDRLIFVKGDNNLHAWSGGVTKVASGTSTTLTKSTTTTFLQDGFDNTSFATIGDATTRFDITNPSGTTYRYTFDGTGTDPVITAASVPVGTFILTGAQNFNVNNNGIFTVTGSGANYFEVTNTSGVAENDKTIGTGFIYKNYTKVFYIGATLFAYTGGESTTTLTGVTPSAAAVTDSVAVQAPITTPNTPTSSGFTNDMCKVINGQVYIGSYSSRLLYISALSSYTNFSVPTPRVPGDPEFLTLDDKLKGIGVRQGKPHIFVGTSILHTLSPLQITVNVTLTETTQVARISLANLTSAYAHEFIDNDNDDIIYLSQDQQVRTVGTFRNLTQTKFPSLSQAVQNELIEEDFTGGHLRCIGDYTYVTAPNNGRHWLHQKRETPDSMGNIVSERLWHAPQICNVARVAVIAGTVYGHSNANPQIYQIWDTAQWHDDSPGTDLLGYECVMALAYRRVTTKNGQRRQGKGVANKLFTEGYMANGVNLSALIKYDYQGASGIVNPVINSIAKPAHFYSGSSAPSLGDASLGDNPLGDGLTPESNDQELLPKFLDIAGLTEKEFFEYEIVYYSIDPDSRWEILSTGLNVTESMINAVELQS